MKFKRLFLTAMFFSATAVAHSATAADFPTRPVELVVPSSAGGGTDIMARRFADIARKYNTQGFIVTNKPGASGGIGMTEVQKATPDGYKVGVLISELAIIPHLGMTKATTRDFIPLARLNADPGLVAVRSDSPFKTIDDLLAQARKQPGDVSIGNAGTGTIWHLAAAALEDKTGVHFNHVPHQGAAPSVLALAGGHVQAIVVSPAEIGSFLQAGKVRVLASMADRRLPAPYSDVQTFKEKGIDLVVGTWRGLAVPLNTPPATVAYLREIANKTAADPEFNASLLAANLQPAYLPGEEFQTFMNSQSAYFQQLLGRLNIQK